MAAIWNSLWRLIDFGFGISHKTYKTAKNKLSFLLCKRFQQDALLAFSYLIGFLLLGAPLRKPVSSLCRVSGVLTLMYKPNQHLFVLFQRCVQIVDGQWSVESCETKAKFVCEHVTTAVRYVTTYLVILLYPNWQNLLQSVPSMLSILCIYSFTFQWFVWQLSWIRWWSHWERRKTAKSGCFKTKSSPWRHLWTKICKARPNCWWWNSQIWRMAMAGKALKKSLTLWKSVKNPSLETYP